MITTARREMFFGRRCFASQARPMRALVGRVLASGLLAGVVLAGSATAAVSQQAASQRQADGELRLATITRQAASLRNVPDSNGRVLTELEQGSIVRIHGERAGWAKVETPTGFAVWVHRKYISETGDPNVVEITRNGVNVRAMPSSGVNNFPVGQLYAGDRVRKVSTTTEPTKESNDWVHIWSPPGFWAWIRTGHLAPLDGGSDGEQLWLLARKENMIPKIAQPQAPAEQKTALNQGDSTSGAQLASDKATRAALDRANAALERERLLSKPNYDLVRTAFGAVLELNASDEVKLQVENRLETVGMLEATASLREELENEKSRVQREFDEIQRAIREDALRRDPLGGQFDERGLLERRTIADQSRYYLRWGGRDVCEVVCASGRYDLDVFLSLDVGVRGEVLPLVAEDGGETAVPIVNLSRIEILGRG